jgi:hypothetical protein
MNCRRPIPSFLPGLVGEFLNPGFDLFLLFSLRHRHVLAIRDHPRRHRRRERLRQISAFAFRDLLRVQQPVVFLPDAASFVPLVRRHALFLIAWSRRCKLEANVG